MALKQITAKDFKDAVSSLTNGYTCWHKLLGRTDAGTELVFVIGWSDAGYDEDDAKENGYADGRYTICSKIACQSRYNGSQSDYDGDFEMPYDKETGDVWDTDTMVSNNESDWEADAATYNKDAQAIWDTYCVPDEDGFTALDALFESKKSSEAKKPTCSMQKKKESLAKKSEADYGAFDWTVGVSYLENGTGEAVKDVYLIKAHNMNSAKEQAILRANRKGSDAHVYSCKLGKHIYGEAKKPTCSMQKKKESLSKKTEMVRPEDPDELKVGKYTADVLTADGEFILSLPAFYDDVAETVKAAKDCLQENSDYVKDTGLVPSKIHVTTVVAKRGWNMPQFVKDVDLNATEAKKPACSMQKKKESLSVKKSKKCEGLMDDLPYDAPVAIESLCAEIMSHTEAFTIEDADVAEMCGKWYIRDYANGSTAAHNEDEFVDEVLAGLSGSPVDGSPFGAAEAEGYARKIYNEVVA